MKLVERIISRIRPAQPAVEYFDGTGDRRDVTEELRKCFEGPGEIDSPISPIVFARKVRAVLDAEAVGEELPNQS